MTSIKTMPPNWRPILFGNSQPADPRPNALFRAAAPSLATADELAACPRDITWVDLRTPAEILTDPVGVPGWPTLRVPLGMLPGGPAAYEGVADILAALRDGTITFGDLYVRMLLEAPGSFAAAAEAVASVDGPVLLACQGGRDRTGTLVAVILDLVGVEPDEIVADYLRTNDDQAETNRRQPDSEGERMLAGFDMTCRASDIEQVLDHLAAHGGARGYLAGHTTGEVEALADRLRPRILPGLDDRHPSRKARS